MEAGKPNECGEPGRVIDELLYLLFSDSSGARLPVHDDLVFDVLQRDFDAVTPLVQDAIESPPKLAAPWRWK